MKTYIFLGSIDHAWLNCIDTIEVFPFKLSVGDEVSTRKFSVTTVKRVVILFGETNTQLVVI